MWILQTSSFAPPEAKASLDPTQHGEARTSAKYDERENLQTVLCMLPRPGEGYSARVTPTMEEVLMEYLICNADGVRRQPMKHRPPMLEIERITAGLASCLSRNETQHIGGSPIAVYVYITSIIWNGVGTRRLVVPDDIWERRQPK
jgi:hypothetical protein